MFLSRIYFLNVLESQFDYFQMAVVDVFTVFNGVFLFVHCQYKKYHFIRTRLMTFVACENENEGMKEKSVLE